MDGAAAGIILGKDGQVQSVKQVHERRIKLGQCPECGQQCFKLGLMRKKALTINGKVENGTCLTCKPLHIASEKTVLPAHVEPVIRKIDRSCVETTLSIIRTDVASSRSQNSEQHKVGQKIVGEAHQYDSDSHNKDVVSSNTNKLDTLYLSTIEESKSRVSDGKSEHSIGYIHEKGHLSEGIDVILKKMQASPDDRELQEFSMFKLSILVKVPINRHLILNCDGLSVVSKAMELHKESEKLQKDGQSIYFYIITSNEIDHIITSLFSCIGVEKELVEKSLQKLCELCENCDKNKEKVVENCIAINTVLRAMVEYSLGLKVQKLAVQLLCMLAEFCDSKYISEPGGIPVLIQSMKNNLKYVEIQSWACRALRALSDYDESKDQLCQFGGYNIIIVTMVEHYDYQDIQVNGKNILLNLSPHFHTIVDTLIQVMQEKCEFQESGFDILQSIAKNEELCEYMVEKGLLDIISLAMFLNMKNINLISKACSLLRILAIGPNIQPIYAAGIPDLMNGEDFPAQCRGLAEYLNRLTSK